MRDRSSGVLIFISSLLLALLFVGTVFVNIGIKDMKGEVAERYKAIDEYRMEIKRVKIEISALTNPIDVITYAKGKGFTSVPVDKVKNIAIKK